MKNIAFTGDVLFQNSIGRTDFPRGDFDTLISSIKNKLFTLNDDMVVIAGHGLTQLLDKKTEAIRFEVKIWIWGKKAPNFLGAPKGIYE